MTKPLALVLYEKILPGSQLVNRLQDLNYRVQTVTDPRLLLACAEQASPMLVLADLESTSNDICDAVRQVKASPATQHLPIIAFHTERNSDLGPKARAAGATLVATDTAILAHLPQLLEQVLQVD